jgi:hypothetical protein
LLDEVTLGIDGSGSHRIATSDRLRPMKCIQERRTVKRSTRRGLAIDRCTSTVNRMTLTLNAIEAAHDLTRP